MFTEATKVHNEPCLCSTYSVWYLAAVVVWIGTLIHKVLKVRSSLEQMKDEKAAAHRQTVLEVVS